MLPVGGRRSHTVLRVTVRATLRPGTRAPHRHPGGELGDRSAIEQVPPSPGSPGLWPRGGVPQDPLSWPMAVASSLQDHLQEGRVFRGAWCGHGGALVGPGAGGLQGEGAVEVEAKHLVEAAAILGCRELVSIQPWEPHLHITCPLVAGAVEPSRSKRWVQER